MWERPLAPIEQTLASGETLLWSGQPPTGLRLRASDALLIPFSLVWCGFAIFWENGVIKSGAPFFFRLWGIPFVLVGLYLVFGRFFVDALIRKRTFYGVSSERIIIVTGLFTKRVKSINLTMLGEMSLTEKSDGTGTIVFGPMMPMGQLMLGGSWPGAGRYAPPAFEMIERAKEVHDLIRQRQTAVPAA